MACQPEREVTGKRRTKDTILCRLGSIRRVLWSKHPSSAARKEGDKGKDQTRILLVNDVGARNDCLPALKCYCSMHADSLVLFAWLMGHVYGPLNVMLFKCRPLSLCNPNPPPDHIHAHLNLLTRPFFPSCSSSARPSSQELQHPS